MKLSASKGLLAMVVGGLLLIVGLFAIVNWILFHDLKAQLTAGDMQLISGQVAELLQKNPAPPDAEINDKICVLIEASVIGGSVGPDRKPLDRFGTPFRVRHTVDGRLHTVTAMSAGVDRQFDTADDIHGAATWESRSTK